MRRACRLRAPNDERGRGVRGPDADFSGRVVNVRELLLVVVEIRDHRVPIGRLQLGGAGGYRRKGSVSRISRGKDSESSEKGDGREDGFLKTGISHAVVLIDFFDGNVRNPGATYADLAGIGLKDRPLYAYRTFRNSRNGAAVHARSVHVGGGDVVSSEIVERSSDVHSELSPSGRGAQVPSRGRVHGDEQFRSRGFLGIGEIPSAPEIRPGSSCQSGIDHGTRFEIEHVADNLSVHVEFRVRSGFSYADVPTGNVQGRSERIELGDDIVPCGRRERGSRVRQSSPCRGGIGDGGPSHDDCGAESGTDLGAFGEIAEGLVHHGRLLETLRVEIRFFYCRRICVIVRRGVANES